MTYLHEVLILILLFIVGFFYFIDYKGLPIYEKVQIFLFGTGLFVGILDLIC